MAFRFRNETLSPDERTTALLEELTQDEKLLLLCAHQSAIPRLGIKENYIGAEVARGLVCRSDSAEYPTTVFPEPFGLAATFDPVLMQQMGEVTGVETRLQHKKGRSSLFVWGPTVDAERDPRWGRNEEGYGEDPFLIGQMSAAYTKGMAGSDPQYMRVIPTLKHFYANNNEECRGSDNASVPLTLKHDYYLKAFERAVREGGARSLMTAYNEINGVEGICNPEISEICKKEWGLLFAVSDGGDFVQNVQFHKHDENHAEAAGRIYANHGADIMCDDEQVVRTAVSGALEQGLITWEDIDRALYGVMKARVLLGEFDESTPFDEYTDDMLCCDAHYKVTETAALESAILLRNSKLMLPLSKDEKLGVFGVHADMNFRDWYTGLSDRNPTILDALTAYAGRENIVYDSGCDVIALRSSETGFYFSVADDGTLECTSSTINEACLLELYEWGDGAVSLRSKKNGKFLCDAGVMRCISDEVYGWFVKECFKMECSGRQCTFRNWQGRWLYITESGEIAVSSALRRHSACVFDVELFSSGKERVRRIAAETKNAVVFCGNNPQIGARECTDRKTLALPQNQRELLSCVSEVNPHTVLYLVSGYPYSIPDNIHSVLHIAHAGPAMGSAVAKTLFGAYSPAGRCPATWYTSEDELCSIKDYNIIRTGSTYLYYKGEPLFPFGHGLSYTSFRYGSLHTNKISFEKDETVEAHFELENNGSFSADEVVQLYVSAPRMPRTMPIKRLIAFKRVYVPRGKKLPITLSFNVNELCCWDVNTRRPELYGGTYELQLGSSSADIRRSCEIKVNSAEYLGIDISADVPAAASWDYLGAEFRTDRALNEYAQLTDWQSFIRFEGCRMEGRHRISVCVANPDRAGRLHVSCLETGREIASIAIPPTQSYSDFIEITADAEPVCGTFTLCFVPSGTMSLKSFRFFG